MNSFLSRLFGRLFLLLLFVKPDSYALPSFVESIGFEMQSLKYFGSLHPTVHLPFGASLFFQELYSEDWKYEVGFTFAKGHAHKHFEEQVFPEGLEIWQSEFHGGLIYAFSSIPMYPEFGVVLVQAESKEYAQDIAILPSGETEFGVYYGLFSQKLKTELGAFQLHLKNRILFTKPKGSYFWSLGFRWGWRP